jgi:hypothetical protein
MQVEYNRPRVDAGISSLKTDQHSLMKSHRHAHGHGAKSTENDGAATAMPNHASDIVAHFCALLMH